MTRPLPIPVALAFLAVLLLSLAAVPPSAAAAGCTLDAAVQPGRSIDLAGSGFAAGAGVTIGVVRSGTPQPSIATTADAAGAFAVSVDAGPGRGGAYGFSATDGACTATTEALAVETAGTAAGGTAPAAGSGTSAGSGATLPPTDATRPGGHADAVDGGPLPAGGALLLVAFGSLLLVLSIPTRRRGVRRG